MLIRSFFIALLIFFTLILSARSDRFPKKILMFLWRGETEVEIGFKDRLQKYHIEYKIVNIAQDIKFLSGWLKKNHQSLCEYDLIYTWGTSISRFVYEYLESSKSNVCEQDYVIPMLFTMVAFPIKSGLIQSFNEKSKFLTGVTNSAPPEIQVKAMEDYLDKPRQDFRIALLYNQMEINTLVAAEEMAVYLSNFGIQADLYPFAPEPNSFLMNRVFKNLFERMSKEKYDFVYIGPDSFLASKVDQIFKYARDYKVPFYSVSEIMVKEGAALFGLVSSYYDVGQVSGVQAEQLLINHKSPEELFVRTINGFIYLLNMKTAVELKKYPNLLLLRQARIVGEK